jgi:hypothetical protein
MTVADHLTGAGALLAVLAVAALVFPRLLAGSQGSRALGFAAQLIDSAA